MNLLEAGVTFIPPLLLFFFDASVSGVGGGGVQDGPGEQTSEESAAGVGQPRLPGAEGHLPAAGHVQASRQHLHVPLLQWDREEGESLSWKVETLQRGWVGVGG